MTDRSSAWSEWVDAACARVDADGQWRVPRTFDALGPSGVLAGAENEGAGNEVVSFASNDYLGLSSHPT
ncbi:MAG TPA: hypothetical protein VHY77_06760, partial [Acidimicrobiales bacterium]|nr:hypothetical protein [Acidimicrobiales bacterium]